jgi:hypothetical protein
MLLTDQCVPISIEECQKFGHVNGSIPNTWGAHNEHQIMALYYELAVPVVSSGCYADALFYTCEMLFPTCDNGDYRYPCRSVCEGGNLINDYLID